MRFHLVMDVIDRVPSLGGHAVVHRQQMVDARIAAKRCTRETGADGTGWGLDAEDVSSAGEVLVCVGSQEYGSLTEIPRINS